MFSLFKDRGSNRASLREEGLSALKQVRGVVLRVLEHANALGELLCAEIKEYAAHQITRLIMVVLACVMLLSSYILLCALVVVLLSFCIGTAWSIAAVLLLNVLTAVLLLHGVKRMAGKKLAPATAEELKNDWQCLKLLCKENNKP